jgi:hypothetical protein
MFKIFKRTHSDVQRGLAFPGASGRDVSSSTLTSLLDVVRFGFRWRSVHVAGPARLYSQTGLCFSVYVTATLLSVLKPFVRELRGVSLTPC